MVCASATSSTSTNVVEYPVDISRSSIASVRDLAMVSILIVNVDAQAHCAARRFGVLRSILRSLARSAFTILVTSFIMSKVDYYNVVLAGSARITGVGPKGARPP